MKKEQITFTFETLNAQVRSFKEEISRQFILLKTGQYCVYG